MGEELKKYGLKIRWSDNKNREPIDFSIEDDKDNIAWVWGSNPWDDVQVECNHPSDHGCVEFGDEDTQGECVLCGATCDWHYEEDNGNVGDYYWKGKTPCIDEWYYPKKIGGIVGRYLKKLQERW